MMNTQCQLFSAMLFSMVKKWLGRHFWTFYMVNFEFELIPISLVGRGGDFSLYTLFINSVFVYLTLTSSILSE